MAKDTFDDFTIEDIENKQFPNWIALGMDSRKECIEYILKYMKEREGLFVRLGLTGPIIKKEKKKK